jgi:hypothetical protein
MILKLFVTNDILNMESMRNKLGAWFLKLKRNHK